MLSRRDLLAGAAALGAARPRAGCQTNAWPIERGNGAQFLDVLARIRRLAFEGFETSFRNMEGKPARKDIEKTGLRFLGLHIFLTSYDPKTGIAPWELLTSVAGTAAELGAERLILSGTVAKGKPDALRRAGDYCRGKRIGLAYHNHDGEFRTGEIEELLRASDVRLMLDAGHAWVGGADVTAFFARHHGRIDGMHLRDFRAGRQVPLGEGDFDLRGLAKAVRDTGWSGWLVNEEERPNDVRPGDAVVEPARRRLRAVFGV